VGSVSTNAQNSPKISSGSGKSFSITTMQVSVSVDTELDFLYGMQDGSTCKHRSSCSVGGSTVENTQCGGATSVTFKLPDNSKHSSCDVGIYNIGFDCGTASATVRQVSATSMPESQASTVPAIATSAVGQSLHIGNLSTSLGSSMTAPGSPITENAGVPMTTSTIYSTSVFYVTSCAPEVTNCPARSARLVTSIIAVSTTVCPVSSAPAGPSSSPPASPSAPNQQSSSPTGPSSVPGSSSAPAGPNSASAGSSSVPAGSSSGPVDSSSAPASPVSQSSSSP